MLELYEKLPEREQLLLIGRLQEMTAPLLGEVKRAALQRPGPLAGRPGDLCGLYRISLAAKLRS